MPTPGINVDSVFRGIDDSIRLKGAGSRKRATKKIRGTGKDMESQCHVTVISAPKKSTAAPVGTLSV